MGQFWTDGYLWTEDNSYLYRRKYMIHIYLCLYFHLQYGSNYGQEVAGNDQHIPAVQKLPLIVLTHFAIVVLMEESGESLKIKKMEIQSLNEKETSFYQ